AGGVHPQQELVVRIGADRREHGHGRCRQDALHEARELATHLGEFDTESANLQITRKTLHGLPAPAPAPVDDPPRAEAPEHPAYQQILTVLADTGGPMRARDIREALDLPILPKNTQGIRSKLKRLLPRGILTEPEPGLFTQPRP
ncbi:hypothetical protein, partial [Streptomyces sp. NPDC091215]|uniref:hypothetical protein n=1 Tax=Streptomyces sp. NPDC091215 TaxID=3155192 RepID=UPI00343847C6